MTEGERRNILISKIKVKLDSKYVTLEHLERIWSIVNNA